MQKKLLRKAKQPYFATLYKYKRKWSLDNKEKISLYSKAQIRGDKQGNT